MWLFVLTDSEHVPVGEITNATDKKLTLSLNKTYDVFSFSVRMDNPLAGPMSDTLGYVKAYRNNVLEFFGPILSAEETGDETGLARLAVNCVGPGWIMSKKYIQKLGAAAPIAYPNSPTPKSLLMADMISNVQAGDPRNLPIASRTYGPDPESLMKQGGLADYVGEMSTGTSTTISSYYPDPWTVLSDEIAKQSAGVTGFDYRILPLDNWDKNAGTVFTGYMGVFFARDLIGTARPNAVFDWGGGLNNIQSYSRNISKETQATRVYAPFADTTVTNGYSTVWAEASPTNVREWYGVEDSLSLDITDAAMRQDLTIQHINVRTQPRKTISFVPHIDPQNTGRMPVYGQDYSLGDYVRGRAVVESTKSVRFDGMFRVYSVTFEIDANNLEKTSVVVSDDGS